MKETKVVYFLKKNEYLN